MRILKKSLACLLVAIIAATAMFGCLVSADTLTGSIYASAPDAYAGDTSITVPVSIFPDANVYITRIKVTSTLGKIASATVVGENVKPLEATDTNFEDGIILIEASTEAGYGYAALDLVFKNDAGFAAGDYSVTLENITNIEGSDWNETGVKYTVTGTEFTLEARAGVEGNPHAVVDSEGRMDNNFPLVEGTTYFTLPAVTGKTFYISSLEYAFTVNYNGETYTSENNEVTITPMADGVLSFTVAGTAEDWVHVALMNPPVAGTSKLYAEIDAEGDYTATVTENMFMTNPMGMPVPDGYFYTYTAPAAGTVTVTMKQEAGWSYVVNVPAKNIYGDEYNCVFNPVNTTSVEVAEGDVLEIRVSPVDENGFTIFGSVDWNLDFAEAAVEPEIVYGALDVNWAHSSLTSYHLFEIDTFKYQKDYFIRAASWNVIDAATNVSYKFNAVGNGFNIVWGGAGAPDKSGAALLTNLSVANMAYDITFTLEITYTDANGVIHVDSSTSGTYVIADKISAIATEEATALVTLINAWKAEYGTDDAVIPAVSETKEFDMTADIIGTADVNWAHSSLTSYHNVRVSDLAHQKDYFIRGKSGGYLESVNNATDVSYGFIVSGNGFNVQWENEGAPGNANSGAAYVNNMSILNMSGDITWKMYFKYTDAEGQTHIDYSEFTSVSYITKLAAGDLGTDPAQSQTVVDALLAFYNIWSAE